MTFSETLFLIICTVGTFNSLLLGLFYLINRKGDRRLNAVFGTLVLLFTLRISKTLWIFIEKSIHEIYHSIWFAAFIITPLVFILYFMLLERKMKTIKPAAVFLIITTIGILILGIAVPGERQELFLYTFGVIVFAFTVLLLLPLLIKNFSLKTVKDKWKLSVYIFFAGEALLFLTHQVFSFNVVVFEAGYFSGWVYVLIFIELKYRVILKSHKKENAASVECREISEKLRTALIEKELYLESDLTLKRTAEVISVYPHLLSRCINENENMNFNDFINSFRIEKAKEMILADTRRLRTISSIAFDCGFNSLSAFNAAFKKFTGRTPSNFISASR